MRIFVIIIFLFLIYSINLTAQDNSNTDCVCCTDNHSQFDFWIGEWTVYDTLGNVVGSNVITKSYENCLLKEEWASKGINKGTSYNYFNPKDSTWNQLWIDNQGTILKLKGSFVENKMVFRNELKKGQKVDWYYDQISWQKLENSDVKQSWEIFDKDNKLLTNLFIGIYKKK